MRRGKRRYGQLRVIDPWRKACNGVVALEVEGVLVG